MYGDWCKIGHVTCIARNVTTKRYNRDLQRQPTCPETRRGVRGWQGAIANHKQTTHMSLLIKKISNKSWRRVWEGETISKSSLTSYYGAYLGRKCGMKMTELQYTNSQLTIEVEEFKCKKRYIHIYQFEIFAIKAAEK